MMHPQLQPPEIDVGPDERVWMAFAFDRFLLMPSRQLLLENGSAVKIGGRAMDLLTILVTRAGELVNKRDLVKAAWPKSVVEPGNLKVNMAALRRLLNEDPATPRFIATVPGRGYRFVAPVRPFHRGVLDDARGAAWRPASGLPQLKAPIIGRAEEIDRVQGALETGRLVSLVGPGGVGKTAIALAVARRVENGQAVTFVDLAQVTREDQVVDALLSALQINSIDGDPLQAVTSILAQRKLLLVLDTCEHVLNAVAHVCAVLLSKTSGLRILATSRQALHLKDQQVERIGPLEVPLPGSRCSANSVLQFSAPGLLVSRATERTGYVLREQDVDPIVDLCRQLDGMPLALELASSRFADSDPSTVLAELIDWLGGGAPALSSAAPCVKALLTTFERSYSLLTTVEAMVLRALSIFSGAFDINEAIDLLAFRGLGHAETFDAVAGLRSKSMLEIDPGSGRLRYQMLETTRRISSDLLAASGELESIASSHSRVLHHRQASESTCPVERSRIGQLRQHDGGFVAYQLS